MRCIGGEVVRGGCFREGGPAVPVIEAEGPADDLESVADGGEGTRDGGASEGPDFVDSPGPPGYAEPPGTAGITEAVEE